MNRHLPKPSPETILYQNDRIYICLASYPLTYGHTVVVWKKCLPDIHLLKPREYEQIMKWVEKTRTVMLKTLHIQKVYLIYMDEARHVHWHLVPRYNEQGYNVLEHAPNKLKITPEITDFVEKMRNKLK